MSMNMVPVVITWVDSKGITGSWEHLEDLEPMPPCEITSIGFLLSEENDYLTIVCSHGDDQLCGKLTIPKCCIKKVTQIFKTYEGCMNRKVRKSMFPNTKVVSFG